MYGTFGVVGVAAIFLNRAFSFAPIRSRRDSLASPGTDYRMLSSEGQLEIRGLRNVGNSCFINAVLQSLASLPPFREYLEVGIELIRTVVEWGNTGGGSMNNDESRVMCRSAPLYDEYCW